MVLVMTPSLVGHQHRKAEHDLIRKGLAGIAINAPSLLDNLENFPNLNGDNGPFQAFDVLGERIKAHDDYGNHRDILLMGDEGNASLAFLQASIFATRPFRSDGKDVLLIQHLETSIHRASAHILPINRNTLPRVHQIRHELVFPQFLLCNGMQRTGLEESIQHRSLQIRGVVHHHQKRAGLRDFGKLTAVDAKKEPEECPQQAVDHAF